MPVAPAFCGMRTARMPAGRGVASLADFPDGQSRDGPPELVTRGEHPVIAMPVLSRRRDKVRQTIEKLKRREFDDASGSRPRGLSPAARPSWRPSGPCGGRCTTADAAALAGEGHDESLAAARAESAGEAEAEEPAGEIAAEFVLNVYRHGPLGFPPLKPALEVLGDHFVERRLLGPAPLVTADSAKPPCGRRRLRAGNPVTAATMGGPAGGRHEYTAVHYPRDGAVSPPADRNVRQQERESWACPVSGDGRPPGGHCRGDAGEDR
jgi:hypothetical protein